VNDALLSERLYWRFRGAWQRLLNWRWAPLLLLALVATVGLVGRVVRVDYPSETTAGHGFIFDERYYVNAARVIAGVPIRVSDLYALQAPAGSDPNGEHPQLAKAMIALGIRAFGDNPIAWRSTAVVFGVASILLLYWLVRCAGGGTGVALGAAAIASIENLWLVSSRIAVLDIYSMPFMLAGVAFYLRRQPVIAGLVIGVGICVKSFTAYALLVIVLLELLRALRRALGRHQLVLTQLARRAARPAALVAVAAMAYASTLAALNVVVPPYHDGLRVDQRQASACDAALLWGGACNHFVFMAKYASELRVQGDPQGIASYPWQFWANIKSIPYYRETATLQVGSEKTTSTVVDYEGLISPVVLYTSWAALPVSLLWAARRRDDLSFLTIAWALGTWLPGEALSLIDHRITYLYYMVITMPALYIAVSRLLLMRELPRWVAGIWGGLMLGDLYIHYPIRRL
jgi:4-amino-4-deoxy-L-arabinose transferase-like glycosyltransferase